MWIVTLVAKKKYPETITFAFETASEMTNFIEKAVQVSIDKLEINISYENDKEKKEGEE